MFSITIKILKMGLQEGCACMGGCVLSIIVFALSLSGLALGIASVVIGAKWHDCYLNDDDADVYLIVVGSLMIAAFVCQAIWGKKKEDDEGNNGYSGLIGLATFGVLIWGMTIFWDTKQGDCSKGQYDYGYYMTHVLMFLVVAIVAIMCIVGLIMACAS